jgi:hypothetical protein
VNRLSGYQEGTYAMNGGTIALSAKKNYLGTTRCGTASPAKDNGHKEWNEEWTIRPDPSNPRRLMLKIGLSAYFK